MYSLLLLLGLIAPAFASPAKQHTATTTVFTTKTVTATTTTGTASTSYVFLPGNSPVAKRDTADTDGKPAHQEATVTSTITTTTTLTVAAHPTTRTVYPCASPLPSPGPAYGDYNATTDLDTEGNALYGLSTPEGASATACCNTCFFGVENCVQAYWYFYEGCVVSQAKNLTTATGQGVSAACPKGTIGGLTYGPDVNPAFRSTGNIAGPCGVEYTNF